jgi:hypothetical protein
MPKIDPAKIVVGLLRLLMTSSINSKTLIEYVEKFRIDPNTYLPTVNNNDTQMPLIYYCCSNTDLTDFFLYLIDKGVKLNVEMVCEDPSRQIELLYYSQIQYIPTLIEKGCVLNPIKITDSIERLLIMGNITKVIILYKCGAISKDQMSLILQKKGLIFRVLDQLYEKLFNISKKVENKDKFMVIYDEIMKHYINVFKFFFKNGVNINQIENGESFVQKVFNTYFIKLIQFVITCQPNLDAEEFMHYSNFGLLNRQVMKHIYNDETYQILSEFLKDKMMPRKIVFKKNRVLKKKSKQNLT